MGVNILSTAAIVAYLGQDPRANQENEFAINYAKGLNTLHRAENGIRSGHLLSFTRNEDGVCFATVTASMKNEVRRVRVSMYVLNSLIWYCICIEMNFVFILCFTYECAYIFTGRDCW